VRRATVATVVAGALVLAACGGGGGSTKASPSADRTAAEKVGLKQSDFPSGWASNPHQASPEEAQTLRQLAQCLGLPDPASHTSADVRSPDFSKGQATTASSEVRFVRTDAEASTDLGGYQSGKASDCLKQAFEALTKQQLPSGLTPSGLAVRQLAFPTLKDGTAAYQATFTIPIAGTNAPVYVDFIFFRAARAEITLATINLGSPFDTKLEQDLAKKMAGRP
jgi:hypothetical protein